MPCSQPLPAPSPKHEPVLLEREVAELMTPGVVTVADNAPVRRVAEAMARHRIRAVLILEASTGKPVGWATTHSLRGHLSDADARAPARSIVDEEVVGISPTATVRSALYALSLPETSRLLVRREPALAPEGVLTETDIALVHVSRPR